MITALTRIAPLGACDPIDDETLQAFLMAAVTGGDRLEHLRVRVAAGSTHADVLAFLDLADRSIADDTLRRLVRRVIAARPELRLWRVL